MDLKTHYEGLPQGGKAKLARRLDIASAYLYQIANGIRPITAERAIAIEGATDGAVTCEEMRPDINWSVVRSKRKRQT